MAEAWTVQKVFVVLGLFLLAGLFEIAGGWLIWKHIREGKPWWWFMFGVR